MGSPLPFLPLEQLLPHRSSADWTHIFLTNDSFKKDCARLYTYLTTIKPSRIILRQSDRAAFLASLLVAFHTGTPAVLPHLQAPGALEELIQPGDLVIDDTFRIPDTYGEADLNHFSEPETTTLCLYTSGSTGSPKAISKTLRQLNAEIMTLNQMWGQTSCPAVWSTVPHHHIYGLLFSLLWPACAGYKIIPQTIQFWEEIANKASDKDFLIASPAHLSRMAAIESGPRVRIFSSGAPLTFDHAQNCQTILGSLPYEILGSTETGGIAYRQQENANQPWTPFSDITIKSNKNQNLILKSPYLANDQFYQTEDRIELLETGQFRLLERADRIVKIEGKRVSLTDIEKRLTNLELIDRAVACALSYKRNETAIVAVLSELGKTTYTTLGKAKFIRHLRTELSHYLDRVGVPRRWRFVDEIPTDSRGKTPAYLIASLFVRED
ncbi:class I adenylate-forming enzyme family protein [Candidatus Odyssella acanthamoebae]|uniref:class I adenylate-forming enzyme family protein n=1 Tax=Candidatus Odyssella acanthamoebae TaxID=91604 RepID=UPI00068E02B3|nr:class I adenylate-forming enzyme family protein [Candidatus Paracaedibacter acanthamoebae]